MESLFLVILCLSICCLYVKKDSEQLSVLIIYSLLSMGLIFICTYSLIVERELFYLAVIVLSIIVLLQDGPKMILGINERYQSFKEEI